jgi:hypothetical protein
MLSDQTVKTILSSELMKQKEFVEEQCFILQELIDSELEDTSSSFLWCSNKMQIVITDDLFRRKRKFRQIINDNNDSDDDDDDDKQDSVRLKFEINSPVGSKSSLPMKTMTFEIDDSSQSEEQENNVPSNDVPENDVPLNLGVPFNYVHHIEDEKRNTPSPIDESESEPEDSASPESDLPLN